jgi:phthalate 4,5-dioxygenase
MLTHEDNDLLTRVGPGSPTGQLLRRYWIPALLASELPEADGAPIRVRLLGEDLIAFRDTSGQVGLLGNSCAHRGASLFFGRNEEGGLRCVYHGWKYDTTGQCIDMPNEPAESNFKEKIGMTAYPCREASGLIWAYMGDPGALPSLPELEFVGLPEDQIMVQKRVQFCNWVQALEGDIDQSHVGFLHSRIPEHAPFSVEDGASYRSMESYFKRIDRRPRYSLVDTAYGVMGCATRDDGGPNNYYRISHFLLPFYTITPPGAEADPSRSIRAWVPVDDSTVMVFGISYHPSRPFESSAYERLKTGAGANWVGTDHFAPATSGPLGGWVPLANMANDFFIDRSLQKTGPYSGIQEFWAQDGAMQESMGAIFDRSREHLGTSDLFIVRMRRRLLEAAKSLQEQGTPPPSADEPGNYAVRGVQVVAPKEQSWVDATRDLVRAVPGTNPGGESLGLIRAGVGAPLERGRG